MNYRYRWLYALALVLVIFSFGYIEYLAPQIVNNRELMSEKEKLAKKLTLLRSAIEQPIMSRATNKPSMENILYIFQQSGMQIQTMNMGAQNKQQLQIILYGSYEQFKFLLNLLMQHALLITDFSVQLMKQNNLRIVLNLTAVNAISRSAFAQNNRSPLCHEFSTQTKTSKVTALFSIKQMRFAGFLRQANEKWALISLPNGELIEVKKDMLLGIEKARILSIESDHVQLFTPNHILQIE